MTSMGNRTRVASMVAQWFSHYATAAFKILTLLNTNYVRTYLFNLNNHQNSVTQRFTVEKILK